MNTSEQTNQTNSFPRDPNQAFDNIEFQLDDLRAQIYILKSEAEKYKRRSNHFMQETFRLERQISEILRLTGFEYDKKKKASLEVN